MAEVNIYQHMAQFDFSKPIKITTVFEGSDNEYYDTNVLKENNLENMNYQIQNGSELQNNTKEIGNRETSDSEYEDDIIIIGQNPNAVADDLISENKQSSNDRNSPLELISSNDKVETKSHNRKTENNTSNQHCIVEKNKMLEKNNNNAPERHSDIDKEEEPSTYVKKMLDRVSQHLILIMWPYYNYSFKNLKQLNTRKLYYFSLTFSTVESLIVPQENNKIFITKLIDQIATDANKIFEWKCERKHVMPFFDEMITWTKQKREKINRLALERLNSSNTIYNNKKNNGNRTGNNINDDKTNNNKICKETNNRILKNKKPDKITPNVSNDNTITTSLIQHNEINETISNYRLKNNTVHDSNMIENKTTDKITTDSSITDSSIIDNAISDNRIIDNKMTDHGITSRTDQITSNDNSTVRDRINDGKTTETNNRINTSGVSENILLRKRLSDPQRPPNILNSISSLVNLQNCNIDPTPNTENNVCLFSSGDPGREISISINPETFHNHTKRQLYNHIEQNRPAIIHANANNITYPLNGQVDPRRAQFDFHDNILQQGCSSQINSNHYNSEPSMAPPLRASISYPLRPRLPTLRSPLSQGPHVRTLRLRPTVSRDPPPQSRLRLPPSVQPPPPQPATSRPSSTEFFSQYPPLSRPPAPPYGAQSYNLLTAASVPVAQPTQNYHTQNHTVNPFTAAVFSKINSTQTYKIQSEQVTISSSVVNNATTSINNNCPATSLIHGHCYICGKNTSKRCSKCKNFSYCSYFCKNMDPRNKKPT